MKSKTEGDDAQPNDHQAQQDNGSAREPLKVNRGERMTQVSRIQRVGGQVTGLKQPLFFGWYVLGATFFIDLVVTGTRNSFGIFVLPMSEEFGWSRFTISLVAALGAIVGGVTQPFIGNIFDRVAGRTVILLGLVIVGLSIIALSLTFHILFLMFMFGNPTNNSAQGSDK